MSDELEIRALIERWSEAVHRGDLDVVLADHTDDIVMYDVPPPHEGLRGIDAYRETWPGFFRWQADGASFELASLDVTAGGTVAYAHALLRCGTPEDLAAKAVEMMERHSITTLVVTEDGCTIRGVIHLHDLLKNGIV